MARVLVRWRRRMVMLDRLRMSWVMRMPMRLRPTMQMEMGVITVF